MKCRICGVEYKDTDRFCGICGTPNPIFEVKTVTPEAQSGGEKPETTNEPYVNKESDKQNVMERSDKSAEVIAEGGEAKENIISEEAGDNSSETENTDPFPDPTVTDSGSSEPDPWNLDDVIKQPEGYIRPNAPETAESALTDVSEAQADAAPQNISLSESVSGGVSGEVSEAGRTNAGVEAGYIAPEAEKRQPKQKEKRMCSLSAVVICIIVILFLSIALGVVGGLYMGEKRRAANMRSGSVLNGNIYSYYCE